jgi:hypothetical protein
MRISRITRPLVMAAVAALALVPAATGQGIYRDATGDNRSAPDVTGVTVAGDATGHLVFRIAIANLPRTDPNVAVGLFLDTDANPNTGNLSLRGAEYLFSVDRGGYSFGRWTGADWDWDTPYTTVRIFGGNGGITISVNKSELGGTSSFNFGASTVDTTNRNADDAPDDGLFNYSLDANGPDIRSVVVETKPMAGPKAGKAFTVTPIGVKLPPSGAIVQIDPKPDSYSCRATLNGRPLSGSGTGRCSFRIPKKKAKGKSLTVTLTVTYQGATKSFPFRFRVA